ncbi:MAG: DegV family protein [Lachnospiraceae bacterium]
MPKQKVGIVAECGCDLPRGYIKNHKVEMVYFLIETDSGVFSDTDEITAGNILSYMASGGKKSQSFAPRPEVYQAVFEKALEKYEEVILVSISSVISNSCANAEKAVSAMKENGKRVHIFDSEHLSTGLGHLVIKAVELAEEGAEADEILKELEGLKRRVSTTFITVNADYLFRSGRVSAKIMKLCHTFHIHPVLTMKNGAITLKSVGWGDYWKSCLHYLRRELKHPEQIDRKRIFITHAGCSVGMIEKIKEEVNKRCPAEQLIVTKASATVSSNCGPNTFGILFVRKEEERGESGQ